MKTFNPDMEKINKMKQFQIIIVTKVIYHEQLFGRSLPNNSFYKSLALDICKKAGAL